MTPGSSRTHGVEQRHRGDLAAGKHVVADRNFFELARFDHPLVDALEAAADDERAGAARELAHARLRERRAARAHQQARAVVVG